LPHTYYIIRILRKLAAKQNSEVHNVLLRTFQSNASAMRWIFARLMSVIVDEAKEKKVDVASKDDKITRQIEVSDQDMIPFDLTDVKTARLRGEIAREVLELFIEVMDVMPNQPNLTYLMFGFSLDAFQLTKTISLGKGFIWVHLIEFCFRRI
jgi:alpha-D-ribose 1-methylphosphonate 5-triphosphate diphosphatase PhnM